MNSMQKKGLGLVVGIILILAVVPFVWNSSSSGESEIISEQTELEQGQLDSTQDSDTSIDANDSENAKTSDKSSEKASTSKIEDSGSPTASAVTVSKSKKADTLVSEDSKGNISAGSIAGGGFLGPLVSPEKATGAGAIAKAKSEISESENEAVLQEKQEPCLKTAFKSDTSTLKGKLQEIKLADTKVNKKNFCVFVDGKPVDYEVVQKDTLRLDWTLAENKAEVTALHCNKGEKCNLVCPEVEKDFWDTIGDSSSDSNLSAGFTDGATSDEKSLQKELNELKEVLNRKPAKALIAHWKVDTSVGVQCENK
ncbi:hypothetical protein GW915_12505 [bacterium]|nr:hypothetical protein [bacterium]